MKEFELRENTNKAVSLFEKSIERLKANLLISKENDAIELFNSEMANVIVRCGQLLGEEPEIYALF